MPKAPFIWLLAAALSLAPGAAPAAQLVLRNDSGHPVTVTVISPCGQGALPLVQVAAHATVTYHPPDCPKLDQEQEPTLRLAVFDQRYDPPGWLAMLIAAKTMVRLPAQVIIDRQDCEECDTIYKLEWLPLPPSAPRQPKP